MRDLLSKTKRVLLGGTALSILAGIIALAPSAHASTVSSISLAGNNITSNAASTSAALGNSGTPLVVNFTTATALTTDAQVIQITLNGTTVAAGQTLDIADLTLSGCSSSNTLEASAGTNNNGSHEVIITNGATGNDNPIILITLDTSTGTLNCPAGAYTLTIASATSQLTASSTAGNYSISITTSLDAGASLFYVGSANVVSVSGSVGGSVAFVIRNSGDTGDLNPRSCDLGIISPGTMKSCSYRLKVTTNAVNGYTVYYKSNTGFTNGTVSMTDAAVGNSGGTGGTDIAGNPSTEAYGITLNSGSVTGGSGQNTTRDDLFNAGTGAADSNAMKITSTSTQAMYTSPKDNNPSTTSHSALVTHEAAVSAGTAAGNYSHTVTYTVAANF